MATPITATQLVSALRAEGVTFVELPGWRTHNRRGAFSPEAFMLHYTAGNYGAAAGDRNHDQRARAYAGPGGILWDGRAGVPGPLCHFGIDKAGTVWLTGWGRTNHAGRVNRAAIDAARNGRLPTSGTHRPGSDDTDGNALAYGIEMMTATSPTSAQLAAAVRVMAAVLRVHGWSAGRVIGHGEASRRKTGDPRGVDMGSVRRQVAAQLATKPVTSGGFKPITPTLGESVPRVIEHTTEIKHGGGGYQAVPFLTTSKPVKAMMLHAVVHGPENARLITRWVSFVRPKGRPAFWDRRAETVHTSNHAETTHAGFTVDDNVEMYLDVATYTPGAKFWVTVTGLLWEA